MRWGHGARRGGRPLGGARMLPVGPPVTMVHGILGFLDQERSRHVDRIRLWKRRPHSNSRFQRRHFPNPGEGLLRCSLVEGEGRFWSSGKTGPRFRNGGLSRDRERTGRPGDGVCAVASRLCRASLTPVVGHARDYQKDSRLNKGLQLTGPLEGTAPSLWELPD
ncbi:hypothetical protein AVEN_58657-1 [Araneus ventricosus]|uniref:Uncharacterized protein n=1 Tax=Araneus ventricosus TaxID=182803 RepID=A0A4Y2L7G5_ARAVE|nr:hypothetical protein AVEN_58657-1 [Araneus ventricosus]